MDCATSHLELKKHLGAMLRKSGSLIGLPIKEVTGHTQPAITCENGHLTFDDLVRLSIGVDGCGKPALRVKIINTCTNLVNCANSSDENPLNKIFAFDTTQKTFAVVLNRTP